MSKNSEILKKAGSKVKKIGKAKNQTRTRASQSSAFYKGRQVTTNSSQKRLQQKSNYRRKRLSEQKRLDLFQQLRRIGVYAVMIILGFMVVQNLQLRTYTFEGIILNEDELNDLNELGDDYVSGLRSLRPFFNEGDFKDFLLDNLSYAADLDVSTSIFSTSIKVTIEPKQPVLKYESIVPSTGNLAIAQDGSLIEVSQENAQDDEAYATLIDASGVLYEPGEQVLSKRQIIFIDQLAEQFEIYDREVVSYQITDQSKELVIRIRDTSYDVLVNQDRAAVSLVVDYVELINSLPEQGREVSSYIDLRVIDKAFYK
jgi:hypothetical protein